MNTIDVERTGEESLDRLKACEARLHRLYIQALTDVKWNSSHGREAKRLFELRKRYRGAIAARRGAAQEREMAAAA